MMTAPTAMALVFVASTFVTSYAVPLPTESAEPTPYEGPDEEIVQILLQELINLKSGSRRQKRAVNTVLGGGNNFLDGLNQGPTYAQLLGQSGGGFNKLGLLSSVLGSSSGSAGAGGDGGGDGGSGSSSILGLVTPLLGSSSGPVSSLLGLGSNPLLDLPGGDGDGADSQDIQPDVDETNGVAAINSTLNDDSGTELETSETTDFAVVSSVSDDVGSSGGGDSAGGSASLGASVGVGGGDVGATAGASASVSGDADDGAAGTAGAAGGSDSGSILSLVTPLLGSSSQGSAGDGSGSGSGSNPVGAGTFGGGFLGSILSTVFMVSTALALKVIFPWLERRQSY